MGYLDENGLARYDGLIKQWVTFKSGTVDGVDPLLNWQKTETAGAVTCYPLPAAPIDPVVNISFTESGPASGEKGPDNPSTITGVESVMVGRCGKNLLIYPYIETSHTFTSGMTASTNADGLVTVDGTAPSLTAYFSVTDGEGGAAGDASSMALTVGETYTASLSLTGGTITNNSDIKLVIVDHEAGAVSATVSVGSSVSFTATSSSFRARLEIKKDTSFSNVTVAPQLELGSTATTFEPYEGADYTIPLNGTYYGGSVDLSAGTMTVTHGNAVINKNTNFSSSLFYETTDVYALGFYPSISRQLNILDSSALACDLLPIQYGGTLPATPYVYLPSNSSNINLCLSKSDLGLGDGETFATVKAAFLTWLTSYPVFVVYPLRTSQTVPLTPLQIYSLSQIDPYTPRINTVYSDQTSVQVGYPKSPQASATELTNAIISLGGEI